MRKIGFCVYLSPLPPFLMLDLTLDFFTPTAELEIATPFLPPLPPLVLKGSETKGESFLIGLNSLIVLLFSVIFSLFLVGNCGQF